MCSWDLGPNREVDKCWIVALGALLLPMKKPDASIKVFATRAADVLLLNSMVSRRSRTASVANGQSFRGILTVVDCTRNLRIWVDCDEPRTKLLPEADVDNKRIIFDPKFLE
jgi:hypothetical protein